MNGIEVEGEIVKLDDSELTITDIDKDMNEAASLMSYWGKLWGIAEGEKELADARYRAWRAEFGKQMLEADPKLAEWKVKQAVEASSKFMKHKEAIATTTRNATVLKARFESFKARASLLQSKGAMLRAEFESTGMNTRSKAREENAKDVIRNSRKKKKRIDGDEE